MRNRSEKTSDVFTRAAKAWRRWRRAGKSPAELTTEWHRYNEIIAEWHRYNEIIAVEMNGDERTRWLRLSTPARQAFAREDGVSCA